MIGTRSASYANVIVQTSHMLHDPHPILDQAHWREPSQIPVEVPWITRKRDSPSILAVDSWWLIQKPICIIGFKDLGFGRRWLIQHLFTAMFILEKVSCKATITGL